MHSKARSIILAVVALAMTPSCAIMAQTTTDRSAGTISGSVLYKGEPPPRDTIDVGADAACGGRWRLSEELIVDKGRVANAFVYVSAGLEGRTFTAPTEPVRLDIVDCVYRPHVLGVMVGQPLRIGNNDGTLHNNHSTPTLNRMFNFAQPAKGMSDDRTFAYEEIMVPISCDVHGWQRCYVGVLAHPYFAVSDSAGAFRLPPIPPGRYTITMWHEKLGTRSQEVTVTASKDASVTFTVE